VKTLIVWSMMLLYTIALILVTWLVVAIRVQAGNEPVCGFIYDLEKPAVEAPCDMVKDAGAVFMGCEVKGYWARWDKPADAVGDLGEKGMAQIHPDNADWMAQLGWSFDVEKDRLEFAVYYWNLVGWDPWSCKHMVNQ